MNVSLNVTNNLEPTINYLEGDVAIIFYPLLILNFTGIVIGPIGKKFFKKNAKNIILT